MRIEQIETLQAELSATVEQRDLLLDALKSAVETIEWMHGCTAPAYDEVVKAISEGRAVIAALDRHSI